MADDTAPGDEPTAETQSDEHVKAFFLDLATKGKDAWNAWRRDPTNQDVYVTFAGVDFSEAPKDKIDFAGFEFGDCANFSGCKWRGVEHGPEAFRPGRACFTGAHFGSGATFAGADFGSEAMFTGAAFGNWASFVGAAFGTGADFRDVVFGDRASFVGAAFGDWANFNSAAFGWRTSFVGVTFGGLALFMDVVFETRPASSVRLSVEMPIFPITIVAAVLNSLERPRSNGLTRFRHARLGWARRRARRSKSGMRSHGRARTPDLIAS